MLTLKRPYLSRTLRVLAGKSAYPLSCCNDAGMSGNGQDDEPGVPVQVFEAPKLCLSTLENSVSVTWNAFVPKNPAAALKNSVGDTTQENSPL